MKFIFASLISFALAFCVCAADATVTWEASPESDIAGYRLAYGTVSGTYTTVVDAGNKLTVSIKNLRESTTYYFVLLAYDDGAPSLSSVPSDEATYTVPNLPPGKPGTIKITGTITTTSIVDLIITAPDSAQK